MEAPLSVTAKGAQNENFIRPAAWRTRINLLDFKGACKIIGLAPEENPSFEFYIQG